MKTIHQERYQQLIALLIDQRKRLGLTQAQLAEKLNKPQSYIAKIERCERKLDVLEYVLLCEYLEVCAGELLAQI